MSIPRPEYSRPQFERLDWINLNGEWTYEFDFGLSGRERGLQKSTGFDGQINVPPGEQIVRCGTQGFHFGDVLPSQDYRSRRLGRKARHPAFRRGGL